MIQRILLLSTAFITKADSDALGNLARNKPGGILHVLDYEDGYLVQIPEDGAIFDEALDELRSVTEAEPALARLLDRVWNAGIYWLRLDRDGPTRDDLAAAVAVEVLGIVRGLPTFSW